MKGFDDCCIVLHSMTLNIAGVEWNEFGTFHEDYGMADISSPRPQTPSNATEVPSANSTGT